ncbi:MAG TPA: sigma-54 dependent transcriptional regulator [Vicinamibacteria bacterium]|nr:sigma-54 dependent transcriptional regulator [Vicinamibacteria bacterium]
MQVSMEPRATVLVVDDDAVVRRVCVELVKARGLSAVPADSVGEGLRLFTQRKPSAVLLDLKLPDGTGLDVLKEMQRQAPGTPVVVISGHGNVPEAVEAMRAGATDFLEKPVGKDNLFRVLDRIFYRPPAAGEADPERAADGSRYGMVGRSEPMRRIYQLIEMASPTKCRVFISGESGTGKELIARAIHALSPRRDRPFVATNCAAIPSELIESEMFGHVKGAFTGATADRKGKFEVAHGGTLFLDEIGDMSLMTQAKLLRALQEGVVTPVGSTELRSVDVRILSATSKNLLEEIARGNFREDLYHRINVLTIAVPPLRSRREDLAELAEHFLRLASVENGVRPKRLAPRATDLLAQLPWKGNVRELRNLMERVVVLTPSEVVGPQELTDLLQMPAGAVIEGDVPLPLREARARFERQYISARLAANHGNLGRTAQELGIERTNLYRKMKQLGIRAPLRGVRPA